MHHRFSRKAAIHNDRGMPGRPVCERRGKWTTELSFCSRYGRSKFHLRRTRQLAFPHKRSDKWLSQGTSYFMGGGVLLCERAQTIRLASLLLKQGQLSADIGGLKICLPSLHDKNYESVHSRFIVRALIRYSGQVLEQCTKLKLRNFGEVLRCLRSDDGSGLFRHQFSQRAQHARWSANDEPIEFSRFEMCLKCCRIAMRRMYVFRRVLGRNDIPWPNDVALLK